MKYLNGPAPAVNGAIVIEHIITCDDPWGEPWAPDGACSIVRRARSFTLWRRISLQTTQLSTAAAQLRGNFSSGRHKPKRK